MFEEFFEKFMAPGNFGTNFMNVTIKDDAYELRFRACGLSKEDITISADNGMLIVESKDQENEMPDNVKSVHEEFHIDRINRRLELPYDADVEGISAEMINGILKVVINKTNKKDKTIEIK